MLLLSQTDLAIAALRGQVVDRGTHFVVRAPLNPLSYQRHALFLRRAPAPGSLAGWVARAQETFADAPSVQHVSLRWGGQPLEPGQRDEARALGFELDVGRELLLSAVSDVPLRGDVAVRPLDPELDRSAHEALDRLCDPSEQHDPSGAYGRYKQDVRTERRAWLEDPRCRWWGLWLEGRLLAQCGFVDCGPIGRFQAVETHPDHRCQGLCTTLVARVAQDALDRGRQIVVLGAEVDGPAEGLYLRLGFVRGGLQHRLLRGGAPAEVRDEVGADRAGVAALLRAAFEGPAEADLVDQLRGEEGVISLVADRAGEVLGHVLFSPATVEQEDGERWQALALGPMAVTPRCQGTGLGSLLARQGLARCRSLGHEVVVVLGHPGYYPRFGFRPAPPLGLTCKWEVPDPVFMVAELQDGALRGRTGRVHYHPAFDAV